MAKRGRSRRDRGAQIILWIISLLVVLSMVFGFLVSTFTPPPPTPVPIDDFPTVPLPTPTARPSPTAAPTIVPPAPRPPTPTSSPTPVSGLLKPAPIALAPISYQEAGASTISWQIPLSPGPGPAQAEQLSFAVCGDSRDGDSVYRRILQRVGQDGSIFLIHLGDIVTHGTRSEWLAWKRLMAGFTIPFLSVPGNHDSPDGRLDDYLRFTDAAAPWYSFDVGPAHFVMLDTHSGQLSPRQRQWLEADLAATGQPVKMLFMHHPPYDPDGTGHILGRGRQQVMNLAKKYRVAHVFAGHIHAYVHGLRGGVPYTITGGCGSPLYAAEHPDGGFYHYLRVTVMGEHVTTEIVRIDDSVAYNRRDN